MRNVKLPGYRFLFYVSLLCGMILSGLLVFSWQQTSEPRFYDPHRLSAQRDINFPFTIEVYGYKYEGKTGDYIDDHILAFGAYEKDILYFMRDYIRARNNPEAVFLDVGACEGQHSLFMSRHVKQVHAFEPFPRAIERFRRLISLNEFTNIRLHEVGLSDKEALVPFSAPPGDNMGSGAFVHEKTENSASAQETLRVVAGDAWLAQFQVSNVELIKIDVEGFEQFVLTGLAGTLKRDRPVVVVELNQPPRGTIPSLDDLKRCFPEGYDYRVSESGDRGLPAITGQYRLATIDTLFSRGSIVMVVAYPKERESLVIKGGMGRSTSVE